jgi:hypothetical protein
VNHLGESEDPLPEQRSLEDTGTRALGHLDFITATSLVPRFSLEGIQAFKTGRELVTMYPIGLLRAHNVLHRFGTIDAIEEEVVFVSLPSRRLGTWSAA